MNIDRLLRRLRALRRDEKGSILVETALVLSAFGLLALLVYDFGGLFIRQMQVTNAVRAGTQYALVRKPVGGDLTQVRAAVLNAAPDNAVEQSVTASLYCECADGTKLQCTEICADGSDRGSYVALDYSELYNMMFRYPGLQQSYRLSEQSTVRLN